MKHLKRSLTLLMLLLSITGSQTFAQDYSKFASAEELGERIELQVKLMRQIQTEERAKEVMQDNEYAITGYEAGRFLANPLMLDGKSLEYGEFSLESKGELTVIKEAAMTGQTVQVPFHVYLKKNRNNFPIPGKEKPDPKQIKIDLSEILMHAEPGDHLVIEAVRKEDGPVRRILKLLHRGC